MKPYYEDEQVALYHGDALDVLRTLPDASINCCVTSPPYFGLRNYGNDHRQYGLESSPAAYVETMRAVFSEVRRVLTDDGSCWLNLGDSYASDPGNGRGSGSTLQGRKHEFSGSPTPTTNATKPGVTLARKNLLGIPWRVAFALQDDGWILRSDIIWAKPNPMPSPVNDRPTNAHEYLFLLTKSPRYYYNGDAIAETATGKGSGNGYHRPESISKGAGQEGKWNGRPQLQRALEIAHEHGLTEKHFAAIRSVGMADAGKARVIQSGTSKNDPVVQALADEAKAALGGYYREFLTGATKNARDVWTIPVVGFAEAHFAVFPPDLAERCVKAGCPPSGTVLDPFSGSGTTGLVAGRNGLNYIGIDLFAEYLDLSLRTRLTQTVLPIGGTA